MDISPVRPPRVMAHAEAVTHSCESPLTLQGPRGLTLAVLRGSSSSRGGRQRPMMAPQTGAKCRRRLALPSCFRPRLVVGG